MNNRDSYAIIDYEQPGSGPAFPDFGFHPIDGVSQLELNDFETSFEADVQESGHQSGNIKLGFFHQKLDACVNVVLLTYLVDNTYIKLGFFDNYYSILFQISVY